MNTGFGRPRGDPVGRPRGHHSPGHATNDQPGDGADQRQGSAPAYLCQTCHDTAYLTTSPLTGASLVSDPDGRAHPCTLGRPRVAIEVDGQAARVEPLDDESATEVRRIGVRDEILAAVVPVIVGTLARAGVVVLVRGEAS